MGAVNVVVAGGEVGKESVRSVKDVFLPGRYTEHIKLTRWNN